jgi:hypothetical protein
MAKFRVWYEEKRRIAQYETLTIGFEREVDTAQENITVCAAFNLVKAEVYSQMPTALDVARRFKP